MMTKDQAIELGSLPFSSMEKVPIEYLDEALGILCAPIKFSNGVPRKAPYGTYYSMLALRLMDFLNDEVPPDNKVR